MIPPKLAFLKHVPKGSCLRALTAKEFISVFEIESVSDFKCLFHGGDIFKNEVFEIFVSCISTVNAAQSVTLFAQSLFDFGNRTVWGESVHWFVLRGNDRNDVATAVVDASAAEFTGKEKIRVTENREFAVAIFVSPQDGIVKIFERLHRVSPEQNLCGHRTRRHDAVLSEIGKGSRAKSIDGREIGEIAPIPTGTVVPTGYFFPKRGNMDGLGSGNVVNVAQSSFVQNNGFAISRLVAHWSLH